MEIAQSRIDRWVIDNDVTKVLSLSSLGLCDSDFQKLILPSNLQTLYCSANNFREFVLDAHNLQVLSCCNNGLTKLVLNTPNLEKLYCHNNKLTELVLNAPNLLQLFCNCNKLTELVLDVGNLTELYCYDNNLTELGMDVAKLNVLSCCKNRYLYLPLKYRNKFNRKYNNINYNYKASIIQRRYRNYKIKLLYNYLNTINYLYNDITRIISLY